MKKLCIILLTLFAGVAQAAPLKNQNIMAVWVSGPYNLTNTRANAALKMVDRYYQKQLGVRIRVAKWVRMKEIPGKIDLKNYTNRFKRYEGYSNWVFSKYRMPKVYIVGPYIQGVDRYMGGTASGVCDPFSGTAVAVGQEINQYGDARFLHSQAAISHELGHVLGADHVDSIPATLMHPDMLWYVNGAIPALADKSKKEIRKCLKMK